MSEPQTETSKTLPPLDKETAMKQYQMMIDLHKFYFEIVLKFLIFHYAVTGAILSYYLSKPNTGVMRFALLFPIFMSVIFGAFVIFGSFSVKYIEEEVVVVTDHLGLYRYPDPKFLRYMLVVAGVLCIAIATALIVVSVARD